MANTSTSAELERRCVFCGCTDEHACPGGCAWVTLPRDPAQICSTCWHRTHRVFDAVAAERARQALKHGDQSHLPDGTGPKSMPLRGIVYDGPVLPKNGCTKYALGLALLAKASTDRRSQGDGTVTYADILLEEVFEALAEDDVTKLRAELVQVAAVTVQWVEALDRRHRRRLDA